MSTGREALHQIDARIADMRRIMREASSAAVDDGRAAAAIDARELEIYAALADLRLAAIDANGQADATHRRLARADADAADLLAEHDSHMANLSAAAERSKTVLEDAEHHRRAQESQLEDAVVAHDFAADATRGRLEQDPDYRASADAVENANATATRAEKKLELARADRTDKGAAFEADPLFMYLHERRYATTDYKAWRPFVVLDDWVARLIDYRVHRQNYDTLLAIPDRIEEHVAHLKDVAAAAEAALVELERRALEVDGVGALRQKVSDVRAKIDSADVAITDAENDHEKNVSALRAAAAGDSGPFKEAHDLIVGAITGLSIPDLKELALETLTLEDDRLVEDLIGLRRERLEMEEARAAAAHAAKRQARQLNDLEEVRRRFKSAKYDSPYSEFKGGRVVDALLSEFLRAAMSRDELWRKIERSHRRKRRDWESDFGGDEWRDVFGMPQDWGGSDWRGGSGPWGGSRPRRGGSRPRMPRPPRRSRAPRIKFPSRGGGGFKTGGGF